MMNQHHESSLDRRIALNDYIVNCNVRKDVKVLIMDAEKRKSPWCGDCGEPQYKCFCDERKQPHQS